MMKKALDIFIVLIICTLCFASCAEKQDTSVLSREFEGEMWRRFDFLKSSYNVKKAPMVADLVMEVDVTDVFPNIYPYHNDDDGTFIIAMTITNPDGSRRSREIKFHLKDKEGNFKSENVGGYYHFELPLMYDFRFNDKGDYIFEIENKYTKDPLYGIKRLNINCLKK